MKKTLRHFFLKKKINYYVRKTLTVRTQHFVDMFDNLMLEKKNTSSRLLGIPGYTSFFKAYMLSFDQPLYLKFPFLKTYYDVSAKNSYWAPWQEQSYDSTLHGDMLYVIADRLNILRGIHPTILSREWNTALNSRQLNASPKEFAGEGFLPGFVFYKNVDLRAFAHKFLYCFTGNVPRLTLLNKIIFRILHFLWLGIIGLFACIVLLIVCGAYMGDYVTIIDFINNFFKLDFSTVDAIFYPFTFTLVNASVLLVISSFFEQLIISNFFYNITEMAPSYFFHLFWDWYDGLDHYFWLYNWEYVDYYSLLTGFFFIYTIFFFVYLCVMHKILFNWADSWQLVLNYFYGINFIRYLPSMTKLDQIFSSRTGDALRNSALMFDKGPIAFRNTRASLYNYYANISVAGYVGFIDFFPGYGSFFSYSSFKKWRQNYTVTWVNFFRFAAFFYKLRPKHLRFNPWLRPLHYYGIIPFKQNYFRDNKLKTRVYSAIDPNLFTIPRFKLPLIRNVLLLFLKTIFDVVSLVGDYRIIYFREYLFNVINDLALEFVEDNKELFGPAWTDNSFKAMANRRNPVETGVDLYQRELASVILTRTVRRTLKSWPLLYFTFGVVDLINDYSFWRVDRSFDGDQNLAYDSDEADVADNDRSGTWFSNLLLDHDDTIYLDRKIRRDDYNPEEVWEVDPDMPEPTGDRGETDPEDEDVYPDLAEEMHFEGGFLHYDVFSMFQGDDEETNLLEDIIEESMLVAVEEGFLEAEYLELFGDEMIFYGAMQEEDFSETTYFTAQPKVVGSEGSVVDDWNSSFSFSLYEDISDQYWLNSSKPHFKNFLEAPTSRFFYGALCHHKTLTELEQFDSIAGGALDLRGALHTLFPNDFNALYTTPEIYDEIFKSVWRSIFSLIFYYLSYLLLLFVLVFEDSPFYYFGVLWSRVLIIVAFFLLVLFFCYVIFCVIRWYSNGGLVVDLLSRKFYSFFFILIILSRFLFKSDVPENFANVAPLRVLQVIDNKDLTLLSATYSLYPYSKQIENRGLILGGSQFSRILFNEAYGRKALFSVKFLKNFWLVDSTFFQKMAIDLFSFEAKPCFFIAPHSKYNFYCEAFADFSFTAVAKTHPANVGQFSAAIFFYNSMALDNETFNFYYFLRTTNVTLNSSVSGGRSSEIVSYFEYVGLWETFVFEDFSRYLVKKNLIVAGCDQLIVHNSRYTALSDRFKKPVNSLLNEVSIKLYSDAALFYTAVDPTNVKVRGDDGGILGTWVPQHKHNFVVEGSADSKSAESVQKIFRFSSKKFFFDDTASGSWEKKRRSDQPFEFLVKFLMGDRELHGGNTYANFLRFVFSNTYLERNFINRFKRRGGGVYKVDPISVFNNDSYTRVRAYIDYVNNVKRWR